TAAALRDPLEFLVDPSSRRADPATVRDRVGEGVPGTEAGQRADVALDAGGGNRSNDLTNPWILEGRHHPRWRPDGCRKRRPHGGHSGRRRAPPAGSDGRRGAGADDENEKERERIEVSEPGGHRELGLEVEPRGAARGRALCAAPGLATNCFQGT